MDDPDETHDERRARARRDHWCDVCHGHTGAGSPCAPDEPEEPQPEEEKDADDDEGE